MLTRLQRKISNLSLARKRQAGQSMVELAIAFPVLLLLFAGLMEVGLVLRSYLVLANGNREAARYAARAPQFVNEDLEDITDPVIAERAIDASGGLNFELGGPGGGNFTVYVHRFLIDTGQPGDPSDDDIRVNNVPTTDDCPAPCEHTCVDWWNTYGGMPEAESYFTGTLRASTVNLLDTCQRLQNENEEFNADMAALTPPGEEYEPSFLQVVTVESFYDHSQVLQIPLFKIFPDPIPLHIATEMRITGVGREKVR
jgi:hypothetical protein